MKIYNSLSNKLEVFEPLHPPVVSVYACGPTVYSSVTIGNWRTYVLADVVCRVLLANGYSVKYVTNITDVGHLTGDNEGDSSQGEDRLQKMANKEQKIAWDIAKHYSEEYLAQRKLLNFLDPLEFTRATDFIDEQIVYVQSIFDKGYAYIIESDGVYFDVAKYESVFGDYTVFDGEAYSHGISRIGENRSKRDSRDFALWKFSLPNEGRHMEWESPWGIGYPGWHIECSVMSTALLGEQIDIHLGGEDLKHTHHPNEIAQTQVVTDQVPYVRYWMHGAFLLVDGGKMSKSLGNAYTYVDIAARMQYPLALRYLYYQSSYQKQQNFTWEALHSAEQALIGLYARVCGLLLTHRELMDGNYAMPVSILYDEFLRIISENFDLPLGLSFLHQKLSDRSLSDLEIFVFLSRADAVLGLNLIDLPKQRIIQMNNIGEMLEEKMQERVSAKLRKDWDMADRIRLELQELGYEIQDMSSGKSRVVPRFVGGTL